MNIASIKKDLHAYIRPNKIAIYQNFFKTGKGQYGEGDIFLGISVPNTRSVAKKYKNTPYEIVEKLLSSKYHEERLLGVLLLVQKTLGTKEKGFKKIVTFYLKNRKGINNWDLVDLSADKIVGKYLYEYQQPKDVLYKYARSKDLWEKRIAILSTFWFIKNNSFEDTLKISEILLRDDHDLIHKAVGWMLREVGKRDQNKEEEFLKRHYKTMPRTMLRYAIEKFPETKRKAYLKSKM
ncbi:MAG: DNA alkylation repair protein [Candidatus Pacebacteria bacterium]|nr:DNA alkylation repair protein [Candidatus Paceibacterota bacterium]